MNSIEPVPSLEEAAAIAAALALFEGETAETPAAPVSGWKLAMRRPELSFDEIRETLKAH